MPEKMNRLPGEGIAQPEILGHRRSRSTATEAQRHRIIEMLRTGPKTTLDFRRAGIMQSQTRIFELRARGYDLPTVGRVTIIDDAGYAHVGVAVYELLAEPRADAASPVLEVV